MLCWSLFLLKWADGRGKRAALSTLELFSPLERLSDTHISSISHQSVPETPICVPNVESLDLKFRLILSHIIFLVKGYQLIICRK